MAKVFPLPSVALTLASPLSKPKNSPSSRHPMYPNISDLIRHSHYTSI